MAGSITREVLEATAHIRQACGGDPLLLSMAALFLSSLALVNLFVSASGLALLAVLAATGSGGHHLALLGFYILVFLNWAVFLLSILLMCFSITVSGGLPWPSSPQVVAANLLASNALTVSKFSLGLSTILLFILLVYNEVANIWMQGYSVPLF